MNNTAVDTAEQWIDTCNKQDIPSLLNLTDPDIEIVGPKGSVTGSQHLPDWIRRANLKLTTYSRYAKGDRVVLEQKGIWYEANGEEKGQALVFTFIRVANGKVAFVGRYDNKQQAFVESGLSEEDYVH